jgi:hypothetical protein
MSAEASPEISWSGRPVGARPSRRLYLMVTGFALVLVALPFWFWYDSWFGRPLTDASIVEYLDNAAAKPRRAQQALVQIGEKLARGEDARKFYTQVSALAAHPNAELRQTIAWIMGQDKTHEPFRPALAKLVTDAAPLVRRNAALALAAFRDPAGMEEIRRMLAPSSLAAPRAGQISFRLKPGDYANAGTLVARIDGEEVRTPLPGMLREHLKPDQSRVDHGDLILEQAADDQHAWEALRAMVLIGTREDVDLIRPFLRHTNAKLQEQAQSTLRAIEAR